MGDVPLPVRFDLAVPEGVRFGAGRVAELPEAVRGCGVTRALVVTGSDPARSEPARRALEQAGVPTFLLTVAGEPRVEDVGSGVEVAARHGCDGVVGYGGGSALDLAKAVALLTPRRADPLDHLEVVGRGVPITAPGLACVAVPTTAGTGAEVTHNAVVRAHGVKASLRSPLLLPRVALVDPDLLAGLPPAAVASGGSDALTQLLEAFLSVRASPVTDALAREGLGRSARALVTAHEHGVAGDDRAGTRQDLALASLLGGICLANAGLGVVHGIAGVVGGRHDAPHGAVCGAMLAAAVRVNARALAERGGGRHPAAAKLLEVARLLTGDPEAAVGDAVAWIADVSQRLGLPRLGSYGVTDRDVPALVAGALRASSTRGNPVPLTGAEIGEVIRRAL